MYGQANMSQDLGGTSHIRPDFMVPGAMSGPGGFLRLIQ